jgi:hypothetical protein
MCGAILILAALIAIGRSAGAQGGQERLEVSGIKAVRPTLVKTIAALEKGDAAAAKAAFQQYDAGWNGIEVYINTRNRDLYNEIEVHYQSAITKALSVPNPDTAAILADAKAMLAKYDEAIMMVEKASPLNALYDDVARLRMARAPLREVNPALQAGKLADARQAFAAFQKELGSVVSLIKARSADTYAAIEQGVNEIDRALKAPMPDVPQATMRVSDVMQKYNGVVNDVTKDARSRQ